jgi:serum/glucocorticoid-regulated kinase 2
VIETQAKNGAVCKNDF